MPNKNKTKVQIEIEVHSSPRYCACDEEWCQFYDDEGPTPWCWLLTESIKEDAQGRPLKHQRCPGRPVKLGQ